ncbi:MAG: thioredoxin-like domain-containing protein [Planctomycetia bacterium]|nr:thioredoxin-like domain-containing protein [Planctomycetia bacterium]
MRKPMIYGLAMFCCIASAALGQSKQQQQIETGLKMTPIQKGQVEYTTPAPEDVSKCKLERIEKGIRIIDPNGLTLREFLDDNGDGAVDQWRYFRDGIEVYRDIDENGNKKADNYRWFNTAGTRWGVDADEDGTIDAWKILSVQELSAEIAMALATGDEARFARILMTPDELKQLGLGEEKYKLMVEKIRAAKENFKGVLEAKPLSAKAVWVQFSGSRPSTFSAGTDGAEKDVDYYENVTCVVNNAGKDAEIGIGTLVRVGTVWKTLDCPQSVTPDNVNELAAGNVFIRIQSHSAAGAAGAVSPNMEELNKLDQRIINAATTQEITDLQIKRADLLEGMAQSATGEDRAQWIRSLADGITGAVQQGTFPDGLERMKKLYDSLKENEEDKNLAAYVQFRRMSTEYTLSMAKSGKSWMQVRNKWLEDLGDFIKNYPDAPDTAEAMLQLAMENENDGMDDKALELYQKIVSTFPDSTSAAKANGAVTRLNSVGKPLPFVAPIYGMEGKQVNVGNLKGRIIVLHFWTSWMNEASRDMDRIKELLAKRKDVVVFGVNLDNDVKEMAAFLEANRISWYQIHEQGGLDSRPATMLGIFSIPTVIVVGPDGTVVNRNAQVSELEDIVKELPQPKSAKP